MLARRSFRCCLALTAGLSLSVGATGCLENGHFSVLGYTTVPNYDCNIKTVYIPIVNTTIYQAGPFRGVEFELTRAIIREIEAKTPYKVVSDPSRADTELLCEITINDKGAFNRTFQNQVREGQIILGVALVWRDLRTGKVLSNSVSGRTPINPGILSGPAVQAIDVPQLDPNAPPLIERPETAFPVTLTTEGRFIPELGESNATGIQMAINRMAIQIVQVMEKVW